MSGSIKRNESLSHLEGNKFSAHSTSSLFLPYAAGENDCKQSWRDGMSMDCRQFLDAKQFEFLLNWFMRRQQETGLAVLDEPLSYDGDSEYDRLAAQLIAQAAIAYVEKFAQPAPAIVYTNLFHLAELELQGKRNRQHKAPSQLQ